MSRMTAQRFDELGLRGSFSGPDEAELYNALMAERAELARLTQALAADYKIAASHADTVRFWQDRAIALAIDSVATARTLAGVLAKLT